ncbi:MAG TPA: hypothetical protein V6C90_24515 [Coleofasciculaceae cyanobacterium]
MKREANAVLEESALGTSLPVLMDCKRSHSRIESVSLLSRMQKPRLQRSKPG